MKIAHPDYWQVVFFLSAAVFVAYQMVRGWRRGLARQFFNLLALIGAYIVAVCGGDTAMPILRPLGYPDVITSLVSGGILALLVFVGIASLGTFLFKRTSQQPSRLARMTYGATGSLIGVVFGLFTVWIVTLAIRLLGTVAESEMLASKNAADASQRTRIRVQVAAPSTMVSSLARMKQSIENGPAGSVVQHVDPLPLHTYSIMNKIVRMISSPESVDRFLAYPGAKNLTEHPKIVALRKDPAITEDIQKGNLLSLLRNEHIVQAANDPELTSLLRRFDLEKALDYSLTR